jgi:AcrR family transcriptional regulator
MEPTLRLRKQLAAMERIQEAAYALLEERGFEGTKVTDIAAAAEVSPSSVYRYFGTKEGVFLWDPLADPFAERLAVLLPRFAALAAVEAALDEVIAALDAGEEEALRHRTQLLLGVPQLRESMRNALHRFGDELAALFTEQEMSELEAKIAAVVTVDAMLTGIEHWAGSGASASLGEVSREAFAALRSVTAG